MRLNANIYPVYNEVRSARKECYPAGISVSSSVAEVNLENLLHHTIIRLSQVDSVKKNILNLMPVERGLGVLTCKWGFDGASGQSAYKQKSKIAGEFFSDSDLFSTTIVPLDLSFGAESVWKNMRASSTRFC